MRKKKPSLLVTGAALYVAFMLAAHCAEPAQYPGYPCGSPRWTLCPAKPGEAESCCPMDHACTVDGYCEYVGDPDFASGEPRRAVLVHRKWMDGGAGR